jgi:23S rRNA pseudouridine2605 synthase
MRINKFIAAATGMSRRAADRAIEDGQVLVNNGQPTIGYEVQPGDLVTLEGHALVLPEKSLTILLNKPAEYVVSRDGQGSRTIYDLLPDEYHHLKPVGRLDKDSSGLLLLTNDGKLANELTHPKYQKTKIYEITLLKPLEPAHQRAINEPGVLLEDGPSKLQLEPLSDDRKSWQITMSEGRNRQIRRTFAALGYTVNKLHRTHFGPYKLGSLEAGKIQAID